MNKIDYLKDRARELRREAGDASNPKLKQDKIEASRAFERLAALAIERRRSKASASPPVVPTTLAKQDRRLASTLIAAEDKATLLRYAEEEEA